MAEHKTDTNDTVVNEPVGNTKKSLRARFWFFTWNNYTEDWCDTLKLGFADAEKYIFQPERGANGTPHIQGCVQFKNARSFDSMKKIHDKIHWEKCASKKAIEYCSKSETRDGKPHVKGYKIPQPEIKDFRPWQADIMKIISENPDDRSIIWVYDSNGGCGKTKLCRHICKTRTDALFLNRKAADMKFAIAQFVEENELKICLLNFTRTVEERVSYEGLEAIKDGIFFCGKYESKQVIYDPPHVICFANFLPDTDALTKDRLKIITL